MKKIIASVCVAAFAAASFGAALPAAAASPAGDAQFIQVAHHSHDHRRPVFEMRGHYAYYNGHRGDRHRHHGWREYHGYWFPPSAFLGAAIGGAILGGIIHSTR